MREKAMKVWGLMVVLMVVASVCGSIVAAEKMPEERSKSVFEAELFEGLGGDGTTTTITVSGGPTYVSGIISSDTTWTAADSPYIVTGSILVEEGVSLTIEPGVVVKFNSEKALLIDGELIAKGTEAARIIFTSSQAIPASGDWINIIFSGTSVDAIYDEEGNYLSGSIMQYCTVDYGGGSSTPSVKMVSSSPFIDHCTITKNAFHGVQSDSTFKVTNSTITYNGGFGVYAEISSGEEMIISGNIFANNSRRGIYCYFPDGGMMSITDNIFTNNSDGGIYYAGYGTVSISSNTITNNSANFSGGIFCSCSYDGTVSISSNTITNNSATDSDGGGIFCDSVGAASISGNTIMNNSASYSGGGICCYHHSGTMTMEHNEIRSNSGNGTQILGNPLINYNDLVGNIPYDVCNANPAGTSVDCTNNWWGTINDAEIQARIYDWYDDASLGIVDYISYLTEPVTPVELTVHNLNTGENFSAIQAAIDDNDTKDGHTIIVDPGTYIENAKVNKSLTIRSYSGNPEDTIVWAANSNDHVFAITADYVNISGFTVEGATGGYPYYPAGIHLYYADYCNISNNTCSSNSNKGIELSYSNNNTISNNSIINNSNAVALSDSNYNVVANNNCSYNRGDSIVTYSSSHGNMIVSNIANSNFIGICIGTNDNIVLNNVAFNNSCGIYNIEAENTKIMDNNFSGNTVEGIALASSRYVAITNNSISSNTVGISLTNSTYNTLINNNVNSNKVFGIRLWYSSNNNKVYLNNFINNTDNAYSWASTNIWNSTEPITYTYNGSTYENFLGNYWSDYTGSDTNWDGIGDTPYSVDSDKDNYPLIELFENYEIGAWYANAHSAHFTSGYYVELMVDDPKQTIQSVSVTGPGINGSVYLVSGIRPNQWWSRPNVDLGTDPPTDLPLVYIFTITNKTGNIYTLQDSVQSYMHEFSTSLSPGSNQTVIGELVFFWTGVSISGARYKVEIYDDSWNRIWDSPLTSACSITYDGPPLSSGNYQYYVCCFNEYGDESLAYETFWMGVAPKTIYVDDDFTDDPVNHRWNTIQEGVDDASSGDTIIVYPGNYTENVDVNKDHLTIQSENGAEATIVQAANPDDHVFAITADYVNISGFAVTGANEWWKAGIYLEGVEHCNIMNNSANSNYVGGIWLDNSSNNTISYNNVSNNSFGLVILNSSHNLIKNNIANNNAIFEVENGSPHSIGIIILGSYNIIRNNEASNNFYGIAVYNFNGIVSVNNIIENNTANNNTVEDYQGERPSPCGIKLSASHNIIRGNRVSRNFIGIGVGSGPDSNILTNNSVNCNYAANNIYGVVLINASYSVVENNTASNNSRYGIYLGMSTHNNITNNVINNNNECGIELRYSSSNNLIYNNYFDNQNNANDDDNNIWNITNITGSNIVGGSYLGGNYWSDYTGEDLGDDGLGDTQLPYNSSGNILNGGDWLPLVKGEQPIFDTDKGTYPSIPGTHNGTIRPNKTITVRKLYTYPCPGTGGHTEYVKIWNSTGWNVTATWDGYVGDWHNISFDESFPASANQTYKANPLGRGGGGGGSGGFTLYANETYNFTIRTGSYPQIIHSQSHNATGGVITCSEFVDINGKRHEGWIPAIKLY